MSEDKPRKVYKRKGIIHICYAGKLFAPSDSSKTAIAVGDEVQIAEQGDDLYVFNDAAGETWSATEITAGPKRKRKTGADAPVRRDSLAVFLPTNAYTIGYAKVSDADEAREISVGLIERYGIAEEQWEAEGWGSVHSVFTLLEVGRVTHGGEYVTAA